MNNTNKGKIFLFVAWLSLPLLVLLTYHYNSYANYNMHTIFLPNIINDTPPPINKFADTSLSTLKKKTDTLRVPKMSEVKKKTADTTFGINIADTFSFKASKDSLNAPVVYHADDSMVVDVPNEKMFLYGKKSSVKYEDNDLSAPQIQFDQKTSIVSAFLKKDSTGKVISYPYFVQKDLQSVSDTIRFNMKTGKGITKGSYSKQGEMFVYGEKFKKADTSVFYAFKTRFTTCNLDTPHFAFVAKKAKFVTKKWAYTGPVHPEFEGVPLPITLPFGIFPLKQGRRSGLLAPTFIADDQRGLALQNLGIYKIINQTWDVIATGTLYSYGSWNLDINPRYYKRYHYQGSMKLGAQNFHALDQPKSLTYNVVWQHNADTKARPGVTFGANVNFQSSGYNKQTPGNFSQVFTNQLGSSITFTKDWSKKHKPFNLTISANHSQNNLKKEYTLNLPDISFSIAPQYPFRKAESTGDIKWYENIGIGYQGNTKTNSTFFDTAGGVFNQISKSLQYGAMHSIPITLSLPPIGPLQISPSVSYSENWFQQKLETQYNMVAKKMDTVLLNKGFYTSRQMGFGISVSTRIFGMYGFKEKSRVKAIRHELSPNISASYTPNMNESKYYSQLADSNNNKVLTSYYSKNIYQTFSNQRFGGLNFSLNNTLSMKIKDKSDTSAKADKKISLLDGLRISGAYNFLADSFQLSNFNFSANTNLFEKLNLSIGSNFDPYKVNNKGKKVNKLSFGRMMDANVSLQTSFKGGDKSKKAANTNNNSSNRDKNNFGNIDGEDEYQRDANYVQNNPTEFIDFEIPWELTLSYSLLLSRNTFDTVKVGFKSQLTHGVNFNASTNLTPKWKIGASGNFDISSKKLGMLTMYLSRDLHCWQMNINVSSSNKSRFFSINISPKSPLLRDLKVNRTRSFTDL